MSTSVSSSSSTTTMTGYAVFSAAEAGSNGEVSGTPEYRVGTSATNYTYGRRVWTNDMSQGLDSGDVAVSLVANPGGGTNGVVWTVSGGGTVPLYYSGASYGNISQLKVVAGVRTAGAKVAITSLFVRFYKNGSLIETIQCGNVEADTLDSSSDTQEQIMTITPTASDNTKVVIECDVRLILQAEAISNPDDLYSRFFVYSA